MLTFNWQSRHWIRFCVYVSGQCVLGCTEYANDTRSQRSIWNKSIMWRHRLFASIKTWFANWDALPFVELVQALLNWLHSKSVGRETVIRFANSMTKALARALWCTTANGSMHQQRTNQPPRLSVRLIWINLAWARLATSETNKLWCTMVVSIATSSSRVETMFAIDRSSEWVTMLACPTPWIAWHGNGLGNLCSPFKAIQ